MALTAVPYKAGVIKDDPDYSREGYASDAQWVRWVRGHAQAQGGYTGAVTSNVPVTGYARSMFPWADTAGTDYVAIGTSQKLYVYSSSTLYNITPERCNGVFGVDPFNTTSGSATVSVTLVNHQATTGDTIYIRGDTSFNNIRLGGGSGSFAASPFLTTLGSNTVICTLTSHGMSSGNEMVISGASAVNGITLSGTYLVNVADANTFLIYGPNPATGTGSGGGTPTYVIGKPYQVTVTSTATFTLTASTTANATGAGGGTGVIWRFELNVGLANSQGTSGYGVDTFGVGLYGVTLNFPTVIQPRTWALDNNGSQLFAVPYGGAIYTWSKDWSQRAARVATAPQRNNHMIVTDERFVMVCGTTQIGALTALANNPISVTSGSPIITLTVPADGWIAGDEVYVEGLTATGSVTISGNYAVSLVLSSTSIQFAHSSPATSTTTGGGASGFYRRNPFVPMRVRNSDGGVNGDLTVWTPSSTNLAGGFNATNGSALIALGHTRAGNYCWSDTAIFFLRYTGQQDNPYTIDLLGEGCGLVGPSAFVEQDGTAYWITTALQPYIYNGGTPRPIPSPMKKYFADRVASDQAYKICAVYDALYPAVTWYYPSNTQITTFENDSYIRIDLLEAAGDQNAGWSNGAMNFSVAIDRGLQANPMAVDTTGIVYNLESGDTAAGATLSRYIQFGPLDIGDGDRVMNLRRWVVNADQQGNINLTLTLRRWPNDTAETKGPYVITSSTLKTDLRGQGRQMSALFQSNNYFRLGKGRLDTIPGSYR